MSFLDSFKNNDYYSRLEVDDEDGKEFTDFWNTGELLCLASAVQRSGDKNWVSVSRSIKPFGELKRPPDWYTPKNCALQYSKLLKGVEDFKKKSLPRTERETSEELLVKNLTDKRITELTWLNRQTLALSNFLKVQIELVESGEYDENLDDLLKQIEDQEKKGEDDFKEWIAKRENLTSIKRLNKCRIPLTKGKAPLRGLDSKRKNSSNLDNLDDTSSVHSSVSDIVIKAEIDTDHDFSMSTKPVHIKTEVDTPSSIAALLEGSKASNLVSSVPASAAPTSPLLTSLLRSVPSSNSAAPVVSYVSSPLKEVKVESSTQSSNSASDNPRKTEVFISPTKTVVAGISPLLTSLLKSPTSAAPTTTSMASHLKEADSILDVKSEFDMATLIAKAVETTPRTSIPQSPRPTPASSPLLNSLLKNSPSAASPLTSIQLSKEATPPKAVSSPQSFFNPTSALATAAAQQLAVATASSLSQSHVFFSQQDAESRKLSIPSSPATSACLSAPTLSKLLEMPPSTPGRLPPLPVVDTVTNTISTTPVNTPQVLMTQSPKKITAEMLLNEFELQLAAVSPTKKTVDSSGTTALSSLEQSSQKKIPVSVSEIDKKPVISTSMKLDAVEPKVAFKHPVEVNVSSRENIDILDAVCESFTQSFENKEIKQELVDAESGYYSQQNQANPKSEIPIESANTVNIVQTDNELPDDLLNSINIEKLVSSDIGFDKVFTAEDLADMTDLFDDDKQKISDMEIDNPPEEQIPDATTEPINEEKANSNKYFKNKPPLKKTIVADDDSEKPLQKPDEKATSKVSPKKPSKLEKTETEPSPLVVNEQILLAAKEAEEATKLKTMDKSPSKSNEIKPPVPKKPRLMEKIPSKEKAEISEDEIPVVKRPGRKAKKGRRVAKSIPVKQDEPKDQYEFSESTEENSVGYQTANTLCYMPRLKEDSRSEESKTKQLQSQTSEETSTSSNLVPNIEKKTNPPVVKNKPGRPPLSARKSIFTSDEEKVSETVTSDDASNSHFGEDKLKWKEFTEKNEDKTKDADEGAKASQKSAKIADSTKKKLQLTKRNLFASKNESSKKEKWSISSDVEESSVCSRDSEDTANAIPWQKEDGGNNESKVPSPKATEDVGPEANDSRMTTESDKQVEVEGSESLQGSVPTEFSPLPPTEVKEEKDLSNFGKQDWFQNTSPKSNDQVSQSSEDSEYESDNWDNQSVSTNKSASHSTGHSSRTKRKERESPQYKAWKKAINIVLREASCHKFANVFLQKVTNDVAPGYLNIVYRPMDLSLIKKNVDNGVVKTTAEVHRDMLLMFQNAVMYNSSDHDVHHMAVEMQRDVIQQIQNFLTTQFNDKDDANDATSSLRGGRSAKSQKSYASSLKLKEESHDKE